jgi:hypothetical protein
MWAHDLRRVGRVDEAIAQFKQADALERAYYREEGIDPALDWHHRHNLDLLSMCYQHKGQMKLGEETMRELASLAVSDAYSAYILSVLPSFLIHRGATNRRSTPHALSPRSIIRRRRPPGTHSRARHCLGWGASMPHRRS